MADSTATEYATPMTPLEPGGLRLWSMLAVTHLMGKRSTDPDNHTWAEPRRVLPGLPELRWMEANSAAVAPFAGRWIAIKGAQVVSDGESFERVHDDVSSRGIEDALITFVHESASDTYDIA